MKYTGNYNLKKPEGSDIVNIEDLNDNADIIDQALKAHDDALATKETPQGAQEKADAALNSAKQYTDQEVGEVAQELAAHKAENASQHGDLTTLKTSQKSSLVEAINELFTNVSNGKQLVGGAITDVDNSIVIPTDPTFQQLAKAIRQINTGKKYAEGTAETDGYGWITVTGLNFRPSLIITWSNTSISVYYGKYSTTNFMYVIQLGGGGYEARYRALSEGSGYVQYGKFKICSFSGFTFRPWIAIE